MQNANHKLKGQRLLRCSVLLARMDGLVKEWTRRARSRYNSAAKAPTKQEKDHIESGAICYFNCSEELRTLADELRASPTPRTLKVRKTRPA